MSGPTVPHLRRNQVFGDAAAVIIGLVIAALSYQLLSTSAAGLRWADIVFAALAGCGWMIALSVNKLYVARVIERPSEEYRRLLTAGALAVGAVVALAFAVQYDELSRLWVTAIYLAVTFSLLIERRIARRIFNNLRASGRISRRVAIIGTDSHAIGLLHSAQRNPALGYDVVGFIGAQQPGHHDGRTVLGPMRRAADILREHQCVGAMISLNSVTAEQVNRLTRNLTDEGFHVALSTSLRDIDVTRMRPQGFDGQTLIYVEPTIRTGWRVIAKRAFDLTLAVTALVLTAPLTITAAILIKLESSGPVLFRQQRVGRDGDTFPIIKLRTMHEDAEQRRDELLTLNEADGPLFKIEHDPRITRVGRILRKLSIDELPQFWNVIRGDMSVVGPRPALPSELVEWEPELHERLRVLPGITGVWQVSGRSDSSYEDYKRLDLYYVDNWSLLHDLRIVLKTFGVVILQRGAR